MTKLINPATGHQINVGDDASADFWEAAGYRAEKKSGTTAKKAPAKKSAAKKSSK